MKKTLKLLFCFVFISIQISPCHASKVIASDFGYDPVDATAAIEDAIDSDADTVVVDNVGSKWIITHIRVFRSDLTMIFEPGVIVEAKENEFGDDDQLFRFVACENITLIGYGATFQMQKAEYEALNDSQSRHCICLFGCNNVKIYGFTLKDSGGDGIYVGAAFPPNDFCENVHIKDCIIDNNYRQGISVISAHNLVIEHCYIANTNNANDVFPEAGIDFEPNVNTERLTNIYVRNCEITGNNRDGLEFYLLFLDSTSLPVSIYLEDLNIHNNGQRLDSPTDEGSSFALYGSYYGTSGHVIAKNCLMENEPGMAIKIDQLHDEIDLQLHDCVIRNVANFENTEMTPIWIEGTYYNGTQAGIGGIHFDNTLISDDEDRPFLRYIENGPNPPGLGANTVTGNVVVENPDGQTAVYGNNPLNISLNVTGFTALPGTTTQLTVTDDEAVEGKINNGTFEITRSGSNVSYPFPVFYSVAGDAENSQDYCFSNKIVVLTGVDTLSKRMVLARQDSLVEGTDTLLLELIPDNFYTLGASISDTIFINDTGIGNCLPDLHITQTIIEDITIKSSNDLTTEALIIPNANVEFRAVNSIELKKGFEVLLGAEFLGTMGSCQ